MPTPRTALLAALVLAASTVGSLPASAQQAPPPQAPPAQAPLARFDPLPPPVPPSRFRKPAMMTAGIVVTAIGVALAVGGAVAWAQGNAAQNACVASGSDECFAFELASGIIMSAFGIAHLAVGVPLLIAGALPPRAPALPATVPAPGPTAGPTAGARSLGLVWSF